MNNKTSLDFEAECFFKIADVLIEFRNKFIYERNLESEIHSEMGL